MDCSTPGFPVLHYLLEHAETHVHRINKAIQASHPLSSPSPPAFHLHLQGRQGNQHRRWPARFTNCPQTPKQIRLLPTSLHGNLRVYQKQTKAKKKDSRNSVWPLPSREMLPRNLQIFHWNYSLNLLSKLNSYWACQSGRMFSCCHHKSHQGLSLWFVWLQENFLSPVAVADKLGYSPGAYITWRDSGLLSREKQLHIPKALPQILPSPPLTQATVIISNGF